MHEPLPMNLLFSFLLHLQFHQTDLEELEDTLHPFYLWLVYQRISFLNLANAFIHLSLRVAKVSFVSEGFEWKNCLTFDTDKLLVFTKLRTVPLAAQAPACVYRLCSF